MTRSKLAVVVVPVMVVAAGWWVFVWNARSGDLAAAEDRIEVLDSRTVALEGRIERARAFAEAGETAERQRAAVTAWIPEDPDIAGFVEAHDALARTSGVTVRSLSPGPREANAADPNTPRGVGSVRLAINIDGGRAAVDAYLRGLNTLSRLVVVDSVKLAPAGDGLIRVDLVMRAFHEQQDDGTGTRGGFGF